MSHSNLQQLGAELRTQRVGAGLSLRDAATRSGIAASTLSRLETGQIVTPRPEFLQALARAYSTDVEDLYALAGYLISDSLPELRPYLRAKYGLPDQAASQIDEYFQALRNKWSVEEKETRHDGGPQAP